MKNKFKFLVYMWMALFTISVFTSAPFVNLFLFVLGIVITFLCVGKLITNERERRSIERVSDYFGL